jgi:hypothetical protein
MKTFMTALISCSLMLGAIAMAQQDQEQQKAKKKKSQQTGQAQSQPYTSTAGGGQQAGARHGKGSGNHQQHASTMANTTGNADVNTNANVNEGTGKNKNKHTAHTEAAMKMGGPSPAAMAGTAAPAGAAKIKAGTVGKNGKTVDVQKIKAAHTNFHAQANPEKIKTVTFNQNYRIVNAEHWQGPRYEVFRVYRPAWHDAGWYHSNFAQVVLIGGGYYYFNRGYWYPAWGYNPAMQYYAYDGPIYVGARAEPPDQVIADVQAELQEQGYYSGEVDGLLGPLTRQALTDYQADHGLYTTAAIDEPTLDALGMS